VPITGTITASGWFDDNRFDTSSQLANQRTGYAAGATIIGLVGNTESF
jgi:hypothetical protein